MSRVGKRVVFPGQVYGKLTVIEGEARRSYDNCILHKCRCECGNELYRIASSLLGSRSRKMCKDCVAKDKGSRASKKLIDLTGQRFGKWTVERKVDRKTRTSAHFECRCDCGSVGIVSSGNLRSGGSRQCKNCHPRWSKGNLRSGWRGYEDIPGKFIYAVKCNAEIRDIEFSITPEDMWSQFIKQKGRCALTGLSLSFGWKSEDGDTTASLDRKDSKGSYTKDNIQWVHKRINIMKMDLTDEEFVMMSCLVSTHKKRMESTEEMVESILSILECDLLSPGGMHESVVEDLICAAQIGMDTILKPTLLRTSDVFGYFNMDISEWYECSKERCS